MILKCKKFFIVVNASLRWLYSIFRFKSLKHLKNLKTGHVRYLGLELAMAMHVLKSQIHLVKLFLYEDFLIFLFLQSVR